MYECRCFFYLSYLEFDEVVRYVDSFWGGQIWEVFNHNFFKYSSLSLSFLTLGPYYVCVGNLSSVIQVCETVHFSSFYFSLYFSDWIILIDLFLSLFNQLPVQICWWAPLLNFSFQLLYFESPEFLFDSFFLMSFYWYSLFGKT